MKKKINQKDNIVKFPKNLSKLERQVEAILFAADEPLDVETIEKRVQSTNNIKKILLNLQADYSLRGFNLVCIKDMWSFRTSKDLVNKNGLDILNVKDDDDEKNNEDSEEGEKKSINVDKI